ncbi:MAG: hypothetical protein D6712_11860 [Chloroflexi bacterium]|nr:MAG: hypothetical protein D6712_11860 [Chloroflexota bacterium]
MSWQDIVAQWASAVIGQSEAVCLIICGAHFGGDEPCSVRLTLTDYNIDADLFEFRFGTGEVLTVFTPYEVLEDGNAIIVPRCDFMRLEWHLPDLPPSPKTLCSLTFTNEGAGILREDIPPQTQEFNIGNDVDVLVLFSA